MARLHMEAVQETQPQMKFFTIYWLGGNRSVVNGKDIADAFSRAGYGGGAVNAIDWYDEGVSETHFYNKQERQWERYVPLHIYCTAFNDVKDKLASFLEKHHEIIIDFPSRDQLSLRYAFGDFFRLGWTKYIEIVYAEFMDGPYHDDGEEDHHFMTANVEYHNPLNPETAIEALIKRMDDPFRVSGMGGDLEVIKDMQRSL